MITFPIFPSLVGNEIYIQWPAEQNFKLMCKLYIIAWL